ncbi:MAG: DUF4276 family protein [Candidatus Poribacteria bacterium]|nr:DUF4276 family protein [Candidatus Poribacteria bacterium]
MPSIRIWTLESDNDAKAVKCLAHKLVAFLQLGPMSIDTTGRLKPPTRLRDAIRILLEDEDCVILIIDRDGPIAHHERLQQPNSLINQIKQIVNDRDFVDRVFLVEAVQELEAWLLIDCLGIFCYYATKRAQFRENCRSKVSANQPLKRLADRYQKGNTENIVEAEQGGRGAKEYLTEFSERVLRVLNPNLTQRNIDREKYQETRSPEVAEHIEINKETLQRNNSLKKLGDVIAQFQ